MLNVVEKSLKEQKTYFKLFSLSFFLFFPVNNIRFTMLKGHPHTHTTLTAVEKKIKIHFPVHFTPDYVGE